MAEGGSKWWDAWLQTAKDKGTSVLEFMKKDLDEFTTTIQQETSTFVTTTTASLKEKLKIDDGETTTNVVKRSVSGLLNSVSNALVLPKEPNEDEAIVIRNSEPVMLNRVELQLHLMQQDANTYLEEPSNSQEYDEWLATFDLDSKQKELTEVLATRSEVRSLYCKMVPSQVSHATFWQHYFYNVHCILKMEEHRLALKQRAENTDDANDDLAWDDDEVLTVQETDRILDDYQRECEEMEARAKKSNKRPPSKESGAGDTNRSLASEIAEVNAQSKIAKVTSLPETERCRQPLESSPRVPSTDHSPELNQKTENQNNLDLSVQQSGAPTGSLGSSSTSGTEAKGPTSEKTALDDRTKETAPDSSLSSKGSEGSLLDDEWEKDFDVGVTDEDVQRVLKQGKVSNPNPEDEDWENWQ